MKMMPLADARALLPSVLDEAALTHQPVTITRRGQPAGVLLSPEDYDSLMETLELLSEPGLREDLAQADRDIADGNTLSLDEALAELGIER